jgi:hypothetical protein
MVSRCSFLTSARIQVVSKETRCQTTWRVRRTLTSSTSRKSPRFPTKTPEYSRLTICSLSAWVPALDGPLDCLNCSAGVSHRVLPAPGASAYLGRAVPFTVGQTSRSEVVEAVGRPAAASAAGHGRRAPDQVEHECPKRMVFDPRGGIRPDLHTRWTADAVPAPTVRSRLWPGPPPGVDAHPESHLLDVIGAGRPGWTASRADRPQPPAVRRRGRS